MTSGVEWYVDDLGAEVTRLQAHGVEFISGLGKPAAAAFENGITTFPWGRLAYFNDSEGNELALVKDS